MYYSKKSKRKVYHEDWCIYVPRKALFGKLKMWHKATKEEATQAGYKPCKWCCGMHGLYLKLKEQNWHTDLHLCFEKEHGRICFRTDHGFWNVRKGDNGLFWLYHLNHDAFDPNLSDTELMKRKHHRQKDVKETENLNYIMNYISKHDRMRPIVESDWRKLPKTTKKKRKYYEQAKKREQRKAMRRLDKIFDQLKGE